MNQRGNGRTEVTAIRGLLAGAALDLEAVRLERILRRKFSVDQPRAPAGQSDGGQWIPSGGGQGIVGQSNGSDSASPTVSRRFWTMGRVSSRCESGPVVAITTGKISSRRRTVRAGSSKPRA